MNKIYRLDLIKDIRGLKSDTKKCLFLLMFGGTGVSCMAGFAFALAFGPNPGIEAVAMLCAVLFSGLFTLIVYK